ncbi:TIR domain-containing protein [Frankia umida]|uniref:TIR domain-containing protein n=1 Tax=Frankia umida TaxID=573489 RepID=UPI003557A178
MIGGGIAEGDEDRDFFVSYTQADRAWAEWISWELEERRFRCCCRRGISPRDPTGPQRCNAVSYVRPGQS